MAGPEREADEDTRVGWVKRFEAADGLIADLEGKLEDG